MMILKLTATDIMKITNNFLSFKKNYIFKIHNDSNRR